MTCKVFDESPDPTVLSTDAPIAYHDFVYPLYTFELWMYV